MNRRGFLKGILAAGVAPAVVGSGILMPVRKLIMPMEIGTWEGFTFVQSGSGATSRTVQDALRAADAVLYGDGITNDTAALQAFLSGRRVIWPDGSEVSGLLRGRTFLVTSTLYPDEKKYRVIQQCTFDCRDLNQGPLFLWPA